MLNARIFFIFPQYIMNSSDWTDCDFKDHLYDSAISIPGVTGEYFWQDDISYPGLKPTPTDLAARKLAELREKIIAFRPDFIVYDACYDGNDHTVNPKYLNEIKARTGARCIGFMADAWGDRWKGAVAYWGSAAERLLYIMPATRPQIKEPKIMSTPYPCNPLNFFPPPEKDIDVSFFGDAYSWRMPFIKAAVEICDKLKLNYQIRGHGRRNDCPDMLEYGRILRQSKIVFNLAFRHNGLAIVTGRVWQAINSACLLLEQDNEQTACYFRPGKHYVPFNTPAELQAQIALGIETWHTNTMPLAAYDFCRKHYSPEAIWTRVFEGLWPKPVD